MNQKCHIKIILLNYMPLPVTKGKTTNVIITKFIKILMNFRLKKALNMCALYKYRKAYYIQFIA